MNLIFFPMFIQGMAGMHRRAFDGGAAYEQIASQVYLGAEHPVARLFNSMFRGGQQLPLEVIDLNILTSFGAFALALAQIPFIINFFGSIFFGTKTNSRNPWKATTLEWACPVPPPHGNFDEEPVVYRGPYEYSVPEKTADYTPQFEPDQEPSKKDGVAAKA
ncbi:MAG: hypothetical protein AAF191_18545 [Verrucomicrobiota bacterium]